MKTDAQMEAKFRELAGKWVDEYRPNLKGNRREAFIDFALRTLPQFAAHVQEAMSRNGAHADRDEASPKT